MARPRVFVSSTYYDLKHVRASLEAFIRSMGFEPVMFESSDIAYDPDVPIDESCYRDAKGADILILIVGSRYGSETSSQDVESGEDDDDSTGSDDIERFWKEYESITKREFESARQLDVPVCVLVDSGVYADYQVYKKNRDNKKIKYPQVENSGVFRFLDSIVRLPRNNALFTFDRIAEAEEWLQLQWVGLFRDLLQRRSESNRIATLEINVAELRKIADTMQEHIKTIGNVIEGGRVTAIIQQENQRLEDALRHEKLRRFPIFGYLENRFGIKFEDARKIFADASSADDLEKQLAICAASDGAVSGAGAISSNVLRIEHELAFLVFARPTMWGQINAARREMGKSELAFSGE